MSKKEVKTFFFFAAPNISENLYEGCTKIEKKFERKEKEIQKEKNKKNPDKKTLRKLRRERNIFKKELIESWTYCPFDLYLAVNKSTLPSIPSVLKNTDSNILDLIEFFDNEAEEKYYLRREKEYSFRNWESEGKYILCTVDKVPNSYGFTRKYRPIDVLRKLQYASTKEDKKILSAINKCISHLEHPNIFKIDLTITEKRKYLYYMGKMVGILKRALYQDLMRTLVSGNFPW